uniref:Pepsin-I3 domain-containing protein n=1 Tax=Steinernema glaseri TaxID=37863 RepID=A0A1I7YJN6_9BILA
MRCNHSSLVTCEGKYCIIEEPSGDLWRRRRQILDNKFYQYGCGNDEVFEEGCSEANYKSQLQKQYRHFSYQRETRMPLHHRTVQQRELYQGVRCERYGCAGGRR